MSNQAKKTSSSGKTFTAEERAAMQERALELRADAVDGEKTVLAAIAKMPPADRVIAKRIHAIVRLVAPTLMPKTWYGMPAYANAEGKAVCFYQGAYKFKARYGTLGFNDAAKLDDGDMWPVAFAIKKLTVKEEKKIGVLVKQAAQ